MTAVINTRLGPYREGDTLPDWIFTITGLADPARWTDAEFDIETPSDTDFDLGTSTWVLSVDGDDLIVTVTPDPTVTLVSPGYYKGSIVLTDGPSRQSVQPFSFFVQHI
jgi:hypothetical protein